MRCEEPVGHAALIGGLWRAARSDRLAHALCFSGPAGVGKFLAAEWLALGLLCRAPRRATEAREPGEPREPREPREIGEIGEIGPPCGVCGPCKRARAGTHPDVFVIDLESENRERESKEREEEIRVHRIARRGEDDGGALADFLALRPAEGGYRIVLVREADRANEEAQNALLKTLEEPGAHTLIVLETARPELLLPTIQSRCARIRFRAPAPEATAEILAACGLAREEAAVLARWSGGAPGLALTLHARGVKAMRAVLERSMKGAVDAFRAAAEVAEIEGEFQSKTALGEQRVRARTFLDLALAVLRDRERAAAGVEPERLPHGDLVSRLPRASTARSASQLEQCLRARQDVDQNLSPDAALERALLALAPLAFDAPARRTSAAC